MLLAGKEPNVVTFTALIDAHAKAKDRRGALNVLKTMQSRNVEPNHVTLRSLLTCFSSETEETIRLRAQLDSVKPSDTTGLTAISMSMFEALQQLEGSVEESCDLKVAVEFK